MLWRIGLRRIPLWGRKELLLRSGGARYESHLRLSLSLRYGQCEWRVVFWGGIAIARCSRFWCSVVLRRGVGCVARSTVVRSQSTWAGVAIIGWGLLGDRRLHWPTIGIAGAKCSIAKCVWRLTADTCSAACVRRLGLDRLPTIRLTRIRLERRTVRRAESGWQIERLTRAELTSGDATDQTH